MDKDKIPSKAERQKAFLKECREEGLTNKQIIERASIFPFGVKSKVLNWPDMFGNKEDK